MGMKPRCKNCGHEHWGHEAHVWTDRPSEKPSRPHGKKGDAVLRPASLPVVDKATDEPQPGAKAARDVAGSGYRRDAPVGAVKPVSPPSEIGHEYIIIRKNRQEWNAYMRAYRQRQKLKVPKP